MIPINKSDQKQATGGLVGGLRLVGRGVAAPFKWTGRRINESDYWKMSVGTKKHSTTPARMVRNLTIVAVLLLLVMAGVQAGQWVEDKAVSYNYEKEHEYHETTVFEPKHVGTLFQFNPRAETRTVIDDPFWPWVMNTETAKATFYEPQDSGHVKRVPAITRITDVNYAEEVVGSTADRSNPLLFDRNTTRCWTNNAMIEPEPLSDVDIRYVNLYIEVTLQYENLRGQIDKDASKTCDLDMRVPYFYRDPGNNDDTWEHIVDFPESYIYAPFNGGNPLYNRILLIIQGHYQKFVWEDDVLGDSRLIKDTGVKPLIIDEPGRKQPNEFYYPVAFKTVLGTVAEGI